ncbi:MAG: ABC transporter permease [Thermomicrobiales bacterium]
MTPLLHSELFRLVRRWMPRFLLAIVILGVGALYAIFWAVVRTQSGDDIEDLRQHIRLASVRDTGLTLVWLFGTTIVVILTASLIGTEFGWGTIRTLLPRARGRSSLLTAKLLTAVLFTAVVIVVGTFVALSASATATVLEDLSGGLGPGGGVKLIESIGRTFFAMLPYLALTFFITVWTRSVAAGVGIGVSAIFLEGAILALLGLAGDTFDRVPGALISRNVDALLAANSTGLDSPFAGTTDPLPPVWQATAVLTAYTIAFLALSYYLCRRRDITVG